MWEAMVRREVQDHRISSAYCIPGGLFYTMIVKQILLRAQIIRYRVKRNFPPHLL